MASTRLRSVIKVTRQASGKTWQVGLWVPADFGHGHVLSRVLYAGFELRKLADQYAKAYRRGEVQP